MTISWRNKTYPCLVGYRINANKLSYVDCVILVTDFDEDDGIYGYVVSTNTDAYPVGYFVNGWAKEMLYWEDFNEKLVPEPRIGHDNLSVHHNDDSGDNPIIVDSDTQIAIKVGQTISVVSNKKQNIIISVVEQNDDDRE